MTDLADVFGHGNDDWPNRPLVDQEVAFLPEKTPIETLDDIDQIINEVEGQNGQAN